MARSSEIDPLEKFRFRVTVIAVSASLTGVVDTIAGLSGQNTFAGGKLAVLTRSGFSEITTPKVNINTMRYRENVDNQRFTKVPGLAQYDPIVLRRGVTANRNLYDWYRLVNDEILLLNAGQELFADSNVTITQSQNFRKDVIIESLDREGNPVKAWYLFNAWPNSYRGGNDHDAQSNEKLVEELGLEYEFFLELEGGIEGLAKELAKGAAEAVVGGVIDGITGTIL